MCFPRATKYEHLFTGIARCRAAPPYRSSCASPITTEQEGAKNPAQDKLRVIRSPSHENYEYAINDYGPKWQMVTDATKRLRVAPSAEFKREFQKFQLMAMPSPTVSFITATAMSGILVKLGKSYPIGANAKQVRESLPSNSCALVFANISESDDHEVACFIWVPEASKLVYKLLYRDERLARFLSVLCGGRPIEIASRSDLSLERAREQREKEHSAMRADTDEDKEQDVGIVEEDLQFREAVEGS